jgi:hypothetical protein
MGAGVAVARVPMAHRLARGLHVSLGRGESKLRGSGAFDDTAGAREAEKCRPRRSSRPRALRKDRVGWSLSFVPQATDMLSALSVSRLYWGPYGRALTIVQGAIFHRLLGILVF